MKFLREITLKNLAAGLLTFIFLVLVIEYFVIRSKFNSLQEIDLKSDYIHNTQIHSQQIALQVQQFLSGENGLSGNILSQLDQQDHYLKTLSEGGRIDGTDRFVKELNRLQKITFGNLKESWLIYKTNINHVVAPDEPKSITPAIISETMTDSTAIDSLSTPAANNDIINSSSFTSTENSKAKLAGQWLTLSSWYDRLNDDIQDEKELNENSIDNYFLIFAIIDLALLGFTFWLYQTFIIKLIRTLNFNTDNQIQTADINKNEIGELTLSINETIEHLKDATEFVEKIGEGNLSIVYKELDSTYIEGKNKLADSLISMQMKLKALNDEEQRRKWANEGLTKFVDILRSSDDNINKLGDNIISALVKYTRSSQGGLYTLNDENPNDKYLELISLFAFDLKKFENQKLKLGQGILGQTFLEKETTYLTEIPEEYIRISSGLGDANPKSILLVPLKVDVDIYGIVELASFNEYQPHEITFVEKLGESIAATLASVKSTQKNRQLIEQFQLQTEQMRAQEEEMRQNMEELQATQEEIARKEKNYISRIAELESKDGNNFKKEYEEIQQELVAKENEFQAAILDLEGKLAMKPQKGDDWALAEQVEKELKVNLEALKIMKQELENKR